MSYLSDRLDEYIRDVVPEQASPVQILETRRAFMAGAYTFMEFAEACNSEEDALKELKAIMEMIAKLGGTDV